MLFGNGKDFFKTTQMNRSEAADLVRGRVLCRLDVKQVATNL